jgi:hypothetical protein
MPLAWKNQMPPFFRDSGKGFCPTVLAVCYAGENGSEPGVEVGGAKVSGGPGRLVMVPD